MLRIEKKNAESPIEQKPRWIRNQVRTGPGYEDMKSRVAGASLHTVCQEAGCPNIHECWAVSYTHLTLPTICSV